MIFDNNSMILYTSLTSTMIPRHIKKLNNHQHLMPPLNLQRVFSSFEIHSNQLPIGLIGYKANFNFFQKDAKIAKKFSATFIAKCNFWTNSSQNLTKWFLVTHRTYISCNDSQNTSLVNLLTKTTKKEKSLRLRHLGFIGDLKFLDLINKDYLISIKK